MNANETMHIDLHRDIVNIRILSEFALFFTSVRNGEEMRRIVSCFLVEYYVKNREHVLFNAYRDDHKISDPEKKCLI